MPCSHEQARTEEVAGFEPAPREEGCHGLGGRCEREEKVPVGSVLAHMLLVADGLRDHCTEHACGCTCVAVGLVYTCMHAPSASSTTARRRAAGAVPAFVRRPAENALLHTKAPTPVSINPGQGADMDGRCIGHDRCTGAKGFGLCQAAWKGWKVNGQDGDAGEKQQRASVEGEPCCRVLGRVVVFSLGLT